MTLRFSCLQRKILSLRKKCGVCVLGCFSHAIALPIVYSFILRGFPPALAEELIMLADFPFLELLIVA